MRNASPMHQLVNTYGPRFEKELLRTGSFRDPTSGKIHVLDERDLEELADSTNRWIEQGYKVWFPWSRDSASQDSRSNIGFWSDFSVEDDRLVAVAVILDERALAQLGRTFSDVTPRISEKVRSASGEWFDRVIESVAAAVTPPVLGLGGFVRLERDAGARECRRSWRRRSSSGSCGGRVGDGTGWSSAGKAKAPREGTAWARTGQGGP